MPSKKDVASQSRTALSQARKSKTIAGIDGTPQIKLQNLENDQRIDISQKQEDECILDIPSPIQAIDTQSSRSRASRRVQRLSLKEQVTIKRRQSAKDGLTILTQVNGAGNFDQSVKGYNQNKLNRDSLFQYKNGGKKHKRNTTSITDLNGYESQQSCVNRESNGVEVGAIEEQTSESGSPSRNGEAKQYFGITDENDYILNLMENDPELQKLNYYSEKINASTHQEDDIREIINFLKSIKSLKGRCDHLEKNLSVKEKNPTKEKNAIKDQYPTKEKNLTKEKKLIDNLEIKPFMKGEYLFKKGDVADYAYIVLYGSVIILESKVNQYKQGQEPPQSPELKKKVNKNEGKHLNINLISNQSEQQQIDFDKRKSRVAVEDVVVIEEEIKEAEVGPGEIIGEQAMIDEDKNIRSKSAMTKTFCVFLMLNKEAFDILIKDKLKKDRESLCQFVLDTIPKLKEQFQFKKVLKNVDRIFSPQTFIRNQDIIKEGERSNKLYLIREGLCVMYKKVQTTDMMGIAKEKDEKVMDLAVGGIFGEDALFSDTDNQYTIKAMGPVVCHAIDYDNLRKDFKRLLPSLQIFFDKRNNFINERYEEIINARSFEKQYFNSKIEKGNLNVFIEKDFKNQVNFADNKTKRKLQVFFIRKELELLQDAKKRLNYELEKEKQEITNYQSSLNKCRSNGAFLKFRETPPEYYVSKVISPQRFSKNEFGQIQQIKTRLPCTASQVENQRASIFSNSCASTQSNLFSPHPRQSAQSYNLAASFSNRDFMHTLYQGNEKKRQSQASLQNFTKGINNQSVFRSISTEQDDYKKSIISPQSRLLTQKPSGEIRFFQKRFTKNTIVTLNRKGL